MTERAGPQINFNTISEVEAFARWYLGETTARIRPEFEGNDVEWRGFIERRNRRLQVQLDDLRNLNFKSAIPCSINKINYFKIVNENHKQPLSSLGSMRKSSRFNFRHTDALQNKVIYFGQDKFCCAVELFHLDIQKSNYVALTGRTPEQMESELPQPKYKLYEYEIQVDNILVLTGTPAHKAIGIPTNVVTDEWYPINDGYEIPTAGQILATAAKKHGFKGILYTSVRTQTKNNLVLFEENTGALTFRELSSQPFDPKFNL